MLIHYGVPRPLQQARYCYRKVLRKSESFCFSGLEIPVVGQIPGPDLLPRRIVFGVTTLSQDGWQETRLGLPTRPRPRCPNGKPLRDCRGKTVSSTDPEPRRLERFMGQGPRHCGRPVACASNSVSPFSLANWTPIVSECQWAQQQGKNHESQHWWLVVEAAMWPFLANETWEVS